MHSRFGMGCCCGAGDGPPFCPPTIRLLDCDGTPIAGATVAIDYCEHFGLVTPIVGTTGADGTYAIPASTGVRDCFAVSWNGVSTGYIFGIGHTRYNCDHTLDFCYAHAGITVTTTGAAAPIVGAAPPVFSVVSGAGTGAVALAYTHIGNCASPGPFPSAVAVSSQPSDPDAKYLDNCGTVTVHCEEDAAISLPLFEWGTDYALYNRTCDYGCDVAGMGPNFRGLIPKVLHVTIETVAGPTLGVYEGVPITVVWNGVNGWTSGCLGSPGTTCSPYRPPYASALLQIVHFPAGLDPAGESVLVVFTEFERGDCVVTPANEAVGCGDYSLSGGLLFSFCNPYFASPMDVTIGAGNPFFGSEYRVHIVE